MKRRAAIARPEELTDAALDQLLRYSLFDSACRIVEAACPIEDLPRFRQQREELKRKLGYDRLPKNGQRSSK